MGHWIGNHTWSHDVPLGESRAPDLVEAELAATRWYQTPVKAYEPGPWYVLASGAGRWNGSTIAIWRPQMAQSASGTPLRRITEIENRWIPLADGTRLAARIWLPVDAEAQPVPAILEYLPYRKRDGTSGRDARRHPWTAQRGYASVRVDIRGSGDSDGLPLDEYVKQEQDDCLEVIAWLAAQPWCSGAVGMIGISWGGFNGLQVAARRPPALKAVITLCSTDDRYADDIHYMGGALLRENLTWGATMFSHSTRPPDPALVGDRWRAMWLERLENHIFYPAVWLRHQRRDAFYQHGSVCEDYAQIQCPVYAVGGWSDGYSNAIPRLLAGLPGPRKGLIGPWAHVYPQAGLPGPAIGFLQECIRWWDHWLKGIDTGIMDEPMLRAWMIEGARPLPYNAELPGRWVAEAGWPSTRITPSVRYLAAGGLADHPGAEVALRLASQENTGLASGTWCAHGAAGDDPGDQREDDGKSLCFDGALLETSVEILGAPVIEVDFIATQPAGKLIARLCDVHPDGASNRVTYGVLNLTHRDSHVEPTHLVPGQHYRVRIQLNDVGYVFPPGHRIRVALSTTYWPIVWPSPEKVDLTILAGGSTLTLPVRPPSAADAALPEFGPPDMSPPEARTTIREGSRERTVLRDNLVGHTRYTMADDDGRVRIDAIDLEVASSKWHQYRVADDDPLSAEIEAVWTKEMGRGDWQISTRTRILMTATGDSFRLTAELDAWEGGQRVYTRNWDETIPRDHV